MKEFMFTWSIENISYAWHKTQEVIISPMFCANAIQFSTWTLRLYPRGFQDSDYMSLLLRRESDSAGGNLAINFELSCLSADTSVLQTRFISETLKTFTKSDKHGFGDIRFLSRHEIFGRKKALYLPKDTLTLRCRMWEDKDDVEFGLSWGHTHLRIERIHTAEKFKAENPSYNIIEILSDRQKKVLISIRITSYLDKLDIEIFPIDSNSLKFTTLSLSVVDEIAGKTLCENQSVWFNGPQNEMFRLPFIEPLQRAENISEENFFGIISEVVFSTGEVIGTLETNYEPIIPEYLSNYLLSCVPSGNYSDFPNISEDLWNLYKEQIFCDVELKTGEGSIFAHKVVLCARSSVFQAMLTIEMKEKENSIVEIEDISLDTMEKFLNFLYTDVFENLEFDATAELYYAADKYQVQGLRFLCSFHLMSKIDVENVCTLLILAEKFHDGELGRTVDDFIWSNEEKVFKSSLWKKFANEQPHLAVKSMLSKYQGKEYSSQNKVFNQTDFLDDLKILFKSNIVSDIMIKAKNATFPAHISVLCASSLLWKDMLLKDFSYKSTDFIEIEDMDKDIVYRLLFFLYTNSLEDIQWDSALKLYRAAIVYQIQRLKIYCSYFLLKSLSVSNAIDLLLLADEQHDDQLKSNVEEYICLYDEQIFTSDKWAALRETNFFLAYETIHSRYKKLQ